MFNYYNQKRVFVTGHTGFKGSWLSIWLHALGAEVYGYSLNPPTDPSNYQMSGVRDLLSGETIGDIRDRTKLTKAVACFKPDIVFHLAAQPLVRLSYECPYETFETNVLGTASILDAVHSYDSNCAVIAITTDKCYENKEQENGYRECDPFGGYDPYSASKGAAEILIAAYRRSYGMNLASVRAGNVIGGGDWALDRIIPDTIRAFSAGKPAGIRNPHAVRPWQHVLEPLAGYLALGERLMREPKSATWCSGWNFGPERADEDSVGRVADLAAAVWGNGVKWEFTGEPNAVHEAKLLRLDITKAKSVLGWQPRWALEEAVSHTISWYKGVTTENARERCYADINAFNAIA